MTALMFGEAERPLFGKFHHAAASRPRMAAVLCPPIGEEGMRAFRTMKILGDQLAAAGVPAFRFDWYGTGDSSGDEESLSLSTMMESLFLAHEEAMEMAGTRKIIWIGLRLGATVVKEAVSETPTGLKGIVLWDPVLDIDQYYAGLLKSHTDLIEKSVGTQAKENEALGFSWPPALIASFRHISDASALPTTVKGLWIGEGADTNITAISDPEPGLWDSDQALNAYVIPSKTLSLIVGEVTSWQRPKE